MTIKTGKEPAGYCGKVVLEDGSAIIFRPLQKEDAAAWLEFYYRLASQQPNVRLECLPLEMSPEEVSRYCTLDCLNQFALVAEIREEGQKRIVATGRYTRLIDSRKAELSLLALDAYLKKGVAAKLIEWLAAAARRQGIFTFESYVLSENTALLSVFENYGGSLQKNLEKGLYHLSFSLVRTPQVVAKIDERAYQSNLKSLDNIFRPRSVAVVGASNRPGAMGNLVLQSLLKNGYKGAIYPINANYDNILSVPAYPSVLKVPGEIDLAIIAAPSSQILNIVEECGRKGVKGMIVIADGFQEKNDQGIALEKEMEDIAFGYGMRIIGPNCMGTINTDPDVKLNATFALISLPVGSFSLVSQSGALGLGLLEYARNLNLGFSSFVSVGNRADIASIDMLQYWEKDPATKVILMYLESFDNPEIFSRVARRVSRQKPILAIKGGSTPEGSRATRSHTGAMATSGLVSEELLKEAGIISVKSVTELFDTAILLANQPAPRGRNIAVVSSGGGPGILAADACARHGLKLPELPAATLAKIKSVVKRDININNPVDLTASVTAEEFEAVLKILADDPAYDAVITIYIPPAGLDISVFENAISRASTLIRQNAKPLVASFAGMTPLKGKTMEGHFVPYYLFPEDAALALSNAVRYHELKTQETGSVPEFPDIDRQKAGELIRRITSGDAPGPLWVSNSDLNELFKCYGIRFAETLVAETPDKAAEIAAGVGFPVVIKLNSTTITHKTDVGGVVLNVKTQEAARQAFQSIRVNLAKLGKEKDMQGVTVQRQITDGVELIVGVTVDRALGPVIMFGSGGVMAEVMQDTALKLHPLTDVKARELINSVKVSRLLQGYRGQPAFDTRSLEDLLLRISAMVEDFPQIAEMDLNPVKVQAAGQGYWVVDGRVMLR